MANSILVLGFTGQGKSTSLFPNAELGIKGLDPKETFIISITRKPLPFKGWKNVYKEWSKDNPTEGNLFYSDNVENIMRVVKYIVTKRTEIKNIVIDDFHYLMVEQYMGKILEGGYAKYNIMSKDLFDLIKLTFLIKEDINLIYLGHPEVENGKYKLKSVGKLVDKSVTPEGYFTYLFCSCVRHTEDGKPVYGFYTNNSIDPLTGIEIIAKTPLQSFSEQIIPNDMGYIVDQIEKYNKGE